MIQLSANRLTKVAEAPALAVRRLGRLVDIGASLGGTERIWLPFGKGGMMHKAQRQPQRGRGAPTNLVLAAMLLAAAPVSAARGSAPPKPLRGTEFGAKGDSRLLSGCAMALGDETLVCASGTFTADQAGQAIAVNGAGASGGELITTVGKVVEGKAVLKAAAKTAINGLYWQGALVGSDATKAFQGALAALRPGECLEVPAGIYFISEGLSLDGRQSNCIVGDGYNRQSTDFSSPNLIYVGSGGSLVRLRRGAISLRIEGLGLSYFGADYHGDLISIGDSGQPSSAIVIRDSSLGGLASVLKGRVQNTGSTFGPAASLIRLNGVYDLNIERNTMRRARVAIQGPTDSYINANGVRIRDNNFTGGFAAAPIQVAGQSWTIAGNIFEPFNNGYGAVLSCGGIALAHTASAVAAEGLTVIGNTWEDARQGQGVCLDLASSASDANGIFIGGNDFAFGGVGVALRHATGVALSGNVFRAFDVGVRSEAAIPSGLESTNAFIATNRSADRSASGRRTPPP